jgi:Na+/H+-dicarboxylate symporter
VFIAQIYGLDLSLSKYVFILFASLMMAGIGAPGIPMASFVLTAILLQMIGLPAEGVGLILLVERFVDMVRTAANVYGNTVTAVLIAESEGENVVK